MAGRFRVDPPAPQDGWLARERVSRRLARRFEVPVLVVTAPAGYGKTSALAQALARPEADRGRDLWLQCEPADEDPAVFGRAVLLAGGLGAAAGGVVDGARIGDMMARFAPDPVCLVLDDVHRIPPASATWELLDQLLAVLPRNGHLLLSGRTAPPLALARRAAAGEVDEVGTRDLEFDDDELRARWADVPGGPTPSLGEAARWPALAALAESGSSAAPSAYVVEEVISAWPAERVAALASLAHLVDVEDGDAVAAGGEPAGALLAGVPLVHRSPDGAFQLHDLWRQAMTDPATWDRAGGATAVRSALSRVASSRLAAQRPVDAARLFAAAGDADGVRRAVLALASQPFVVLHASEVGEVAGLGRSVLGEHLAVELLEIAGAAVAIGEVAAAEAFEGVVRRAAASGDGAIEALALQHAVNMRSILDPDRVPTALVDRAETLAPAHPAARTTAIMGRFHQERSAGRAEEAMAQLQTLAPPTNDRELVTFCFGMTDLGRPENIDAVVPPEAAMAGGELRLDLAAGLWLRGTVTPEVALEFGSQLVDAADDGGYPHVEVSANATFALIALSAGDDVAARRFADAALRRTPSTASVPVQAFAQVADALCVMVERGEHDAAPRLEATLDLLPIRRWPPRPYLFALPSVYLLAPSVRTVLDRCRFGPSLTAALDAGRALVALRDRGECGAAADLAWDRPELLRVHVLPPQLAELAAAGAAAGSGAVGHVLGTLPGLRGHLASVAGRADGPTGAWAKARISAMPARPDDDLRIDVLGPMRLRRGATTVVDTDWVKRDRVRQLLAFLAVHRRTTRRAVVDALWPQLDPEKGAANLRVNLTHLQRVLQPGRPTEALPWFVQADAESLVLADDGVVLDLDVFEARLAAARELDDRGQVRLALDAYRGAVALVRGGLLDDWPEAAWADMERLRTRTLAIGARCRTGELQVALGEPEEAARTASEVLTGEPLQERAGRLLASALAAQGDRATARRVLSELVERLRGASLAPEPETERAARQHGLAPG